MIKWLPLLALAIVLTGCTLEIEEPASVITERVCIKACEEATISLENGPCLLNPIENTEWVCDVAHEPREDIDNQVENQCSAFREGKAKHFVEVDTNCNLIKKV